MSLGDIFLVDDNLNNLDLLESILLESDYDVRMANSGRRALEAIRAAPPDLIMLDITMPEMDGYEVCRQLKAAASTRDIPVIFISALDDALDKVKAFKVGGVDYVTKPFQAPEVLARIENQLTIARLRKELEKQNQQLIKEREALIAAHKQTEMVFSALAEVLPGTVLDEKYRLEDKIGSGGFGCVYRSTHLGLNRSVAIKIFRPMAGNDIPEGLDRFRLEGISASRVTHPNAISVLDYGISQNGIAYLVMELLCGHTLADELRASGKLSPQRCAEIILPICDVLVVAHAAGIVHRDIKPDNIFLHQSNDGEVVKVVDFGLAKLFAKTMEIDMQNMTRTGNMVGTPVYMAPERLANKPYDGRTDIYSLGVMFYEMLSGRAPFHSAENDLYAVAMMHLTKAPTPLREISPEIPPALETIVMNMLIKDANLRPSAKEIAQELMIVMGAPSGARANSGQMEIMSQWEKEMATRELPLPSSNKSS
jgi:serine/threonine protein kinase